MSSSIPPEDKKASTSSSSRPSSKKKKSSTSLLIGVVCLLALGAWFYTSRDSDTKKLRLDELEEHIANGDIQSVVMKNRDNAVKGKLADGTAFSVTFPKDYSETLTNKFLEINPAIEIKADAQKESFFSQLLMQLIPVAILVGAFMLVMANMQGGAGQAMKFGKAKAKTGNKDQPKVTFADVAGADEAVEELREIEEFLKNPKKFQSLGAKIPKGVLLYGPPGTGKTLLARAVAGEAGAPFFSMSGSDFVEMFVGVGASRVRDLFAQAKAEAPAIIFVDEIDAVGRHRGAGMGGGHDEREQTLNQLLVEMDGFEATSGVIVIAATNRPDILDPALLRPGRFDRHIVVDAPDIAGRRAILEVHAQAKPLANNISLDVLARRTPGFTGADLANTMNEAALLSARRGHSEISQHELEEAVDRVMGGGPERKSRIMQDHEKRVIAYHEAGHALVGHVLPTTDPIHKVSIVARGQALGWTLALPVDDKMLKTRTELCDDLAMLFGGRTAEELVFSDVTTGAANDIERATQIARAMVTQFGMSDSLGLRLYGSKSTEPLYGKDRMEQDYSDDVAARIDDEVHKFLDTARETARRILIEERPTLDRIADALLEKETIGPDELALLFEGLLIDEQMVSSSTGDEGEGM